MDNDDEKMKAEDSQGQTQFLADESGSGASKRIPTLLVLRGKNIGDEFVLKSNYSVIGRTLDNDIFINDPKISRRHAGVTVEQTEEIAKPPKCIIKDLGSTNGIRVNDCRVSEAALLEGDKITLGDTILRFNYQDAVDLKYQSQIKTLINIDHLTRLLAKRAFDVQFEQALIQAKAEKSEISVFMMDLDHFKNVNDEHDHLIGSFVLHEVGAIIKRVCDPHGVSGRYGGEEFVSFFSGMSKRKARLLAEEMRKALEEHLFVKDNTELHITISIGVSCYPEDGDNPDALITRADHALYEAKRCGRNRVCISESTQDNIDRSRS